MENELVKTAVLISIYYNYIIPTLDNIVYMEELEQKNRIVIFEESIKSNATKLMYRFHLKKYFDSSDGHDPFFDNDNRAIEQKIIEFILSMKQQGKGYFPIHNHISAIMAFYAINDIVVNVKK
jgi:hypothetical protein